MSDVDKQTGFTNQDLELLTAASPYVTIALENARLYEDLKALDKARERAINHLAHEMRTPLAVLSAVLQRVGRRIDNAKLKKPWPAASATWSGCATFRLRSTTS